MTRYHVSEDGNPRICTAQSPDTCTAQGVDGNAAPHGDFVDSTEARRFAESILDKKLGGSELSSTKRQSPNPVVTDRTAFSTDMSDSSKYRVENGRLRAVFEGEEYDMGELREASSEEINSWSQNTLGEDADFQDGEICPVYDENGDENGAFARFGDRYYRAGSGDKFYQV